MTEHLEIRCSQCGGVLTHYCTSSLKQNLEKLFSFVLEDTHVKTFKKSEYYEEGDEKAPFFSESFLYNLLGKEDARTVLACLGNFIRAMGVDPDMTQWPVAECRHRLYQAVGYDRTHKPTAEWCEQCGALRHYNDKEDQPGEWALPVNKEPKP